MFEKGWKLMILIIIHVTNQLNKIIIHLNFKQIDRM